MSDPTLEEIKSLVLISEKLVLEKKKLRDFMADTLRNQINNLKIEKKKWQIK